MRWFESYDNKRQLFCGLTLRHPLRALQPEERLSYASYLLLLLSILGCSSASSSPPHSVSRCQNIVNLVAPKKKPRC